MVDGTSHTIDGQRARRLAESHGVVFSPWRIVTDMDAAVEAADSLGYPVALKSAASDIVHKSDLGCVRIGITTSDALRAAVSDITRNAGAAGSRTPELMMVERMVQGEAEVVVGLKRSATFGPTILVGMGGIWVELLQDFALRLCPIDAAEARLMLQELRGYRLLAGMRGRPPCDLDALVSVIVSVSEMGVARGDLVELDLNPVMVLEEGRGAIAVDARAVVAGIPRSESGISFEAQNQENAQP